MARTSEEQKKQHVIVTAALALMILAVVFAILSRKIQVLRLIKVR